MINYALVKSLRRKYRVKAVPTYGPPITREMTAKRKTKRKPGDVVTTYPGFDDEDPPELEPATDEDYDYETFKREQHQSRPARKSVPKKRPEKAMEWRDPGIQGMRIARHRDRDYFLGESSTGGTYARVSDPEGGVGVNRINREGTNSNIYATPEEAESAAANEANRYAGELDEIAPSPRSTPEESYEKPNSYKPTEYKKIRRVKIKGMKGKQVKSNEDPRKVRKGDYVDIGGSDTETGTTSPQTGRVRKIIQRADGTTVAIVQVEGRGGTQWEDVRVRLPRKNRMKPSRKQMKSNEDPREVKVGDWIDVTGTYNLETDSPGRIGKQTGEVLEVHPDTLVVNINGQRTSVRRRMPVYVRPTQGPNSSTHVVKPSRR